MYAAIFTRTYPLKDAAAVFAAVANDGFKGVQANLSSVGLDPLPVMLPPGIAARFGAEARAKGIRIRALSGTYNMAHPDAKVRLAYRPRFRNAVQAAVEMGATIVSLCTGSRDEHDQWKFHPANTTAAAWSDLRAELDFALGVAEEAGISLALEPEPANVIHDATTARRILDEVKSSRLGIILDAANLVFPASLAVQSEVMWEAAGLLGDSLLLAHAKDIDASGNVVAPGEGAVDLPAFVKALRSVGYDDALIAHGFSADKTRPAAKALDRLIAEPA
jgi:sugar phosphate isomerase/epimerase